jgi:hypothetical protein
MALGGLWGRVTGLMFGIGIGRTAGAATEPIFELVRQEAWQANANRVLSITQVANLVAMGITDFDSAAEQAARDGFDTNRLRAMVEYYLNPPQYGYAYDALRRGTITEAQFRHVLRKQGIEGQYHDALVELRHVLPSVTDMVRFAVREVYNPTQRDILDLDAEFPDAFADAAEKIGLERDTAADYWAAHWELPSYTQATQMLFRKEIKPPQFKALLKALDYAPTWRGPLEAIARAIPTMSDMIRFAVREVYNPPLRKKLGIDAEYPNAFTAQAALHGMSEEHAREYWAAHWRLPSARQGYQMMWRKEIEPADLDNLLKALDYPPAWRDKLANIAHIVPGRIDLKRMFKFGILTRAEVKQGYVAIGYDAVNAERMTQIAEAEMTTGSTRETWASKARTRLYTVAHNEYLDNSINEATARSVLAEIGATATEQDAIIQAWNVEEQINRLELTPTQVRKAYKSGRWTLDEALAALEAKEMTRADAEELLQQ